MKLLVVGHSYVTPFAQAKYVAMIRLDPTLQLRIVVPHEVPHRFMTYRPAVHPALDPACLTVMPAIFNYSPMTRILHPGPLAALMRCFDPDHIHIEEDPHSSIGAETATLAFLAARRATISFFIWDNLARQPAFPKNIAKTALTRYSFARCSLVICGNSEGRRLLHDVKGWQGRSSVLPQIGLDPREYQTPLPDGLAQLLGKDGATPLIGCFGRLVPEKGVTVLLEALGRLSDRRWKLLVVGSGPLTADLRSRWSERFGDRLILLDALPHDRVSQHLRCLDIFVSASYGTPLWKEQFGLTLAQAMMAGVACIGSSSGAIPEVVGPGGLIVAENNVAELAAALERMLASADLRRTLGMAARAYAMERYSDTAVARSYLAAFQSVRDASVERCG
jgi:glycosyltransferase involved in cell wall biosynthesis